MKAQHSLKISLHGMNDRMHSMMTSYLELNCKGIAFVTEEPDADAEIVDVDLAPSKNILQERLAQQPSKPIIALSLYDIPSTKAIYVKKPIKAQDLIKTINTVKNLLNKKTTKFNNVPDTSIRKVSETIKQKAPTKKETKPLTSRQSSIRKKITSTAENSSQPHQEIDKFLQEFTQRLHIMTPKKVGYDTNILEKNRRNTVRYTFQGIKGTLKKNSFLRINKKTPISIQSISSKGALIKTKQSLKTNENITLTIKLDSLHVFTIPAIVIRKNSKTTYGLTFVDYQHTLTEYLISSGDSFNM